MATVKRIVAFVGPELGNQKVCSDGCIINLNRPAWTTSPAREEGRPRNPLLPGPGAAQARALSRQLV